MSDSNMSQYKDLFVRTAREYVQSLNACLLKLENDPTHKESIDEIFRSAHSLKGQSAAMNYLPLGYLCHVIEDVFYEIQNNRLSVTTDLATLLFSAFDQVANTITSIETTGTEPDLTEITQELKEKSGVHTTGAGKSERQATASEHEASPAPVSDSPPASDQPPALSDTPVITPSTEEKSSSSTSAELTTPPSIHTSQISVKAKALDDILALVEELLISEGKIKHLSAQYKNTALTSQAIHSEQLLDTLHYQVMKTRAVPLSLVFEQLPRTVRDVATREEKQVEFEVTGGELEMDRSIVERLTEPLVHLLRNAVSHGIKTEGKVWLIAQKDQDWVNVEVKDSGAGIDWNELAKRAGVEKVETDEASKEKLLFSGTSTAKSVSEISGRGVGLLTVKHMVEQSGGVISFSSEKDEGTSFLLRFPLSLAVMSALCVKIQSNYYLLPSALVAQILSVSAEKIRAVANQAAIVWQEQEVVISSLGTLASETVDHSEDKMKTVVVIRRSDEYIGLLVDEASEVLDIVIKPVPVTLSGIDLYAGSSILPNGTTALVLNPKGL